MSDNNNRNAGGGIGFCGLLAILFIALKLLDKIDWSWLWVLAPLWIPPLVLLAVVGVFLLAVGALAVLDKMRG